MRLCAALLLVGLTAVNGVGQESHPLSGELVATPNRPTVTDTADTTQIGVLELEFGIAAAPRQQQLQGLLKFGLLRDLELEWAGSPWQHDASLHLDTVTDTNLGFRWRFLHQGQHRPTLSFQYRAKLPSAGTQLGSGATDHQFALLASKDLPAGFRLDANLDYFLLGRRLLPGFDHTWAPAFTLSHPVHGKLGISMEFSAATRVNAAVPGIVQNLWALSYAVKPRLVLDGAVQTRLTGPVPSVVYLMGFTYSIADFYHHRR